MLYCSLRAVHGGAANGEHKAANSGAATQWHEHVNASGFRHNIKRLEADIWQLSSEKIAKCSLACGAGRLAEVARGAGVMAPGGGCRACAEAASYNWDYVACKPLHGAQSRWGDMQWDRTGNAGHIRLLAGEAADE
jgi:hypothetical protein